MRNCATNKSSLRPNTRRVRDRNITREQRGQIAVFVVLLTIIVASFVSVLAGTLLTNSRALRRASDNSLGLQLAESGIDKALWCLNHPTVTGCSSYAGETAEQGAGAFSVTASTSGTTGTITGTGTVNGQTRTVKIQVANQASESVSFFYGLQSGTGGITMDNNAKVVGNVYSNGSVTGSNNSRVTGDAVLAVGNALVNAAADPNPYTITNFGTSSSTQYVAQSFVPTVSEKVYEVDLKVGKYNNPSANLTIEIRNDSGGNPGSVLGSTTLNSGTIPDSALAGWENGWTEVNVLTSNALTSGTPYWVVLKASSTNATKYFKVVRANDDALYASGTAKIGSSFSTLTPLCGSACDMAFQVKMGGTFPILKVAGSGSIPGVGGNAYANTIESTTAAKHACYQTLVGTVKAGNGTETCSATSTGQVPCVTDNTEDGDTPQCHAGNDDPAPAPFPLTTAQISQMEAQAEAGGVTTCSPTCAIAAGASIGPQKYLGDVTLPEHETVTLNGTVWVTGTIRLRNSNILMLSEGYGSSGGIVIAHDPADEVNKGRVVLEENVKILRNSNTTTNILMLAMNKSDESENPAFKADNNVNKKDGDQDDEERLVIYAHNGVAYLDNNVNPEAITAKRIHLSENTEITYLSGLQSAYFSSGPGGAWKPAPQTWQDLR